MPSDFEPALKKQGWQLLPGSIENYFDGDIPTTVNTVDDLVNQLLDLDLNKFGTGSSSENPDAPAPAPTTKADVLSGPLVLQITRVRNVSAPKANETSHGAPQLLKVTVTDGSAVYTILQIGSWTSVNLDTPPGTKLLLKNGQTCRLHCNFLPLKQNQFSVLGGTVAPLVEKWQMTKVFGLHNRKHDTGAPKWIPFGHKIASANPPTLPPGQFKSLESEAKQVKDNEAFDQQRQANIEEIAKAFDVKKKTFGKGKLPQQDQPSDDRYQDNQGRFRNQPRGGFSERGRGRRERSADDGGRPRFERRGNSRREDRDESDSHSFPSKPTTLFDFLTNKLADPEVTNDATLNAINNATQMEFKPYGEKKDDHRGSEDNRRGRHSGHFSRGGPRNHSDTGRSYPDHNSYGQQKTFGGQSRHSSRGNQRADFHSSHQGHSQHPNDHNYPNTLQAGDKVLARYWEDQKMHRAIISELCDAGQTCVIQFVDYDNYEEVFLKDVQPCLTQIWETYGPGTALTGAESGGGQRQNRTDQQVRPRPDYAGGGQRPNRAEFSGRQDRGADQPRQDGGRSQDRYAQGRGHPQRNDDHSRPGRGRGEGNRYQQGRGHQQRNEERPRYERNEERPRGYEETGLRQEPRPPSEFSGSVQFRRGGRRPYVQSGGRGRSSPPPTARGEDQPRRSDRPERQFYKPPGQRRP